MSDVVRLDIQTPFTAETAPNLYSAFLPMITEKWPSRDFTAEPLSFVEVATHVLSPCVTAWEANTIDMSTSEEDLTQEKVRNILQAYSPNCVFFNKKFYFRNEEDLTHCKMSYM